MVIAIMFSELISVLTVIVGTLAAFTLVALVILYCVIRPKYWHLFSRRPTNSSKSDTECKNPNCVRCQLYADVLTEAKRRFIKYLRISCYSHKTNRISDSFDAEEENDINQVIRRPQKPTVFHMKKLKSEEFIPSDHFQKDVHILERSFNIIYSEFDNIQKQIYESHWLKNDTPTGRWKVFHLVNQGEIVHRNAEICPKTFSTVMKLPSLMDQNVFGNVAFSVIDPGTTISVHYGPTNIRTRCHLGLIAPPSFKLSVTGEQRAWNAGKCLLFDDSYLHGVQHTGSYNDGIRAVLIVDLWHQNITEDERVALDFIFAPLKVKS